MTETIQRSVFPDGVHKTPDGNGQKPPITELTTTMIFAPGTGFVLTPFGKRMQAVLMDYCYRNTGEPSAARMIELQTQIVRTCEEIGVDPTSLATKREQFNVLVQTRQDLMRERWLGSLLAGGKVLTEV